MNRLFQYRWHEQQKNSVEASTLTGAYCDDDKLNYLSNSEANGLLVLLGFDITVFTPAAYQRHNLWRPLMEISSWGGFRA